MLIKNLKEILSSEPAYRFKQADKAIYVDLISNWDEATIFSLNLREKLNKECPLSIKSKLFEDSDALKALIYLEDKNAIETVLMRHRGRNTVCLSSQVGCPVGCLFCATGNMGFERNLTFEEIIIQVLYWARYLKKVNQRVNNIVFMGMGEPFLNYDEVMKAVEILNDPNRFNIGSRKISISTCGIPDGIKELSREKYQLSLAFSLHAANERLRSEIMPINKSYPLGKVLDSIREYIKITKRKVMIEYVMLADVNDTEDDARELVRLLKNNLENLYFVNLISYNKSAEEADQIGKFKPSSADKIAKFKKILENSQITVIERYRFGRNIKGACGQLAGERT
jgi:23S rRNA (adenine2503-C2)-methyltransferase